ncbi:redox-sensitive transcriptional activator SoxR [Deinococcus lacus]|uniref:Redox-sensitive transcriptional activator SoxR n=1 Tax=Deinococcus lacus TaxID=392561 RepID=A0ABW1YAY2_9DEIO
MGIPLARIQEALQTLPQGRTPTAQDWGQLSAVWHDELNARITTLERLRDDLSDCIGCGCLSLETCRLYNPGDEYGYRHPGKSRLSFSVLSRQAKGRA